MQSFQLTVPLWLWCTAWSFTVDNTAQQQQQRQQPSVFVSKNSDLRDNDVQPLVVFLLLLTIDSFVFSVSWMNQIWTNFRCECECECEREWLWLCPWCGAVFTWCVCWDWLQPQLWPQVQDQQVKNIYIIYKKSNINGVRFNSLWIYLKNKMTFKPRVALEHSTFL